MPSEKPASKKGLLKSVLTNKCPRCRTGNLFVDPNPYHLKNTMKMPETCPICRQKFELQTGFYFGTGFVSYGLTVFFSALTFVLWWFTIGVSVHDNRLYWWLAINALVLFILQPPIQRLARSVWIAFFVRYENNAGVR
jgi:hypothetical protein